MFADKDHLFYKPITDDVWQKLLKKYEIIELGEDTKIAESYRKMSKLFKVPLAGFSRISSKSGGETKMNILKTAHLLYYKTIDKKKDE